MEEIHFNRAFDQPEYVWSEKTIYRLKCAVGLLIVMVSITVIGLFAAFAFYIFTSGGEGSIPEAERMASKLRTIDSPETSLTDDAEVSSHRFENGEWICALSRSSHGFMSKYRGGGTMVIKDSRGRVRCFMGHICGESFPNVSANLSKDLDGFDSFLQNSGEFRETVIP